MIKISFTHPWPKLVPFVTKNEEIKIQRRFVRQMRNEKVKHGIKKPESKASYQGPLAKTFDTLNQVVRGTALKSSKEKNTSNIKRQDISPLDKNSFDHYTQSITSSPSDKRRAACSPISCVNPSFPVVDRRSKKSRIQKYFEELEKESKNIPKAVEQKILEKLKHVEQSQLPDSSRRFVRSNETVSSQNTSKVYKLASSHANTVNPSAKPIANSKKISSTVYSEKDKSFLVVDRRPKKSRIEKYFEELKKESKNIPNTVEQKILEKLKHVEQSQLSGSSSRFVRSNETVSPQNTSRVYKLASSYANTENPSAKPNANSKEISSTVYSKKDEQLKDDLRQNIDFETKFATTHADQNTKQPEAAQYAQYNAVDHNPEGWRTTTASNIATNTNPGGYGGYQSTQATDTQISQLQLLHPAAAEYPITKPKSDEGLLITIINKLSSIWHKIKTKKHTPQDTKNETQSLQSYSAYNPQTKPFQAVSRTQSLSQPAPQPYISQATNPQNTLLPPSTSNTNTSNNVNYSLPAVTQHSAQQQDKFTTSNRRTNAKYSEVVRDFTDRINAPQQSPVSALQSYSQNTSVAQPQNSTLNSQKQSVVPQSTPQTFTFETQPQNVAVNSQQQSYATYSKEQTNQFQSQPQSFAVQPAKPQSFVSQSQPQTFASQSQPQSSAFQSQFAVQSHPLLTIQKQLQNLGVQQTSSQIFAPQQIPQQFASQIQPQNSAFQSQPQNYAFQSQPQSFAFQPQLQSYAFQSQPQCYAFGSLPQSYATQSQPLSYAFQSQPQSNAFQSQPQSYALQSQPLSYAFQSRPQIARSSISPYNQSIAAVNTVPKYPFQTLVLPMQYPVALTKSLPQFSYQNAVSTSMYPGTFPCQPLKTPTSNQLYNVRSLPLYTSPAMTSKQSYQTAVAVPWQQYPYVQPTAPPPLYMQL